MTATAAEPTLTDRSRDALKRAGNPFRNYFARNPDDEVCARFHVPELFSAERDLLHAIIDLYRYDPQTRPDGLRGQEGTFSACSFWYVEALTRAGRLEEARLAFEKMLTYANHRGLYAEQISRTGKQQGNFPQALTHLALISAAFNLDRALD